MRRHEDDDVDTLTMILMLLLAAALVYVLGDDALAWLRHIGGL